MYDYNYNPHILFPGAEGGFIGAFISIFLLVYLLIFFVAIALTFFRYIYMWKLYKKVGRKPWTALVPVLSELMLVDICGKPWWWAIMMYLPGAQIVFGILMYLDLARAFNKSGAWAAGLYFLPFVFFPILAFSTDACYERPADFPEPWVDLP